ncbi:hypothetical protein HYQ46_011042 [Verticillium longisporum]|nr:hypothetical protein HYQ46_011042 [Verticillium longisporum]
MMTNNVDRLSLAAFSLLASQVSITGASSMRRVTRSSIDSPSTAGLVARDSQHEPCWSVISLNPKKHGCKAAELAVNGTCQPLTFGDALESCPDDCEPGQWCDEGKCEPIQIILDPLHCGDITPVELAPGEVCVNGVAIPLDLTEDPYVCGPGEDKTKACDPGNYCDKGVCTPITLGSSTVIVGTDPYHCGVDAATCKPGQLCVDGGCHDIAVGQPLDKCKKEDLHPGTFCWESDIIPMHISTYPGSCPEGQVSVSGVCFGDLPKTCVLQGGSGSGSGSGSSSGSSSGSGSSSSGTVKGSAQYGGWFPDAGYGSVQHNGQWYNFGRPSSCGDKSCGPNSFCCGNTCLPLGGGSEFEGCGSGCSNGEFCYRDSCRPVYIGQPGGGPDGEYVFDCPCGDTVCGLDEVCIGGAVCVDLTPGNPGSCGSYGACPPSFICLKDTCVPGGGGGGDGEPGVCNPTCANDERCVDGACVLLSQPGRCDPACEGDDSCLNGPPTCNPECAEGSTCVLGVNGISVCVPDVTPPTCEPECADGFTCALGVGGVSICIPDAGPPVCTPECDEGSTCTLGLGGVGVCVPDVTPPACTPECGEGFTCVISVGGVSVCIPVVVPPVCNPECGDGFTCVINALGITVCIPDVTPPVCTPECGTGFTCVIGAGGLSVCVPEISQPECNPACGPGFNCIFGVNGVSICVPDVTPPTCTPECGEGFTCALGVGGVGVCIPDTNPGCEPACSNTQTCVANTCVPATCNLPTVSALALGKRQQGDCPDGFTCAVGAGGTGICVPTVDPNVCNPTCAAGSTCINNVCVPDTCTIPTESVGVLKRQTQGTFPDGFNCVIGIGGVGACVPDLGPEVCNPVCGPGFTCVEGQVIVQMDSFAPLA